MTPVALDGTTVSLLFVAFVLVLAFEAVNGCHDTSNAVATIIYTHSMPPMPAVIWSGCWNFLGVLLGGTAVAFTFVHLLPLSLLTTLDTRLAVALVMSPLLAALIWNVGTWLMGLPVSSSHSLVGALIGVGIADVWVTDRLHGGTLNWHAVGAVGLGLLISPVLGFALAYAAYRLVARFSSDPRLHDLKPGDVPPMWLRGILTVTCAGVSFTHGSNDGQKTIGLFMLVMMSLAPAAFALDPNLRGEAMTSARQAAQRLEVDLRQRGAADPSAAAAHRVSETLSRARTVADVPAAERARLRADILMTSAAASPANRESSRALLRVTEYAPTWVLGLSALCLGFGTMVGWKRIVMTVGEKIGKTELTPAQGGSAEVIAMATISLADIGGFPVSTTHVLSSGVAGTMIARRSGVQGATVKSIALAWILTLPATLVLAVAFFCVLSWILT